MTNSHTPAANAVCIASYFKGVEFLRECGRSGARVTLVTRQRAAQQDWPRAEIDEFVALPDDAGTEFVLDAVSRLARERRIDVLAALEEFDVLDAALAREHLLLPGLGLSAALPFRDKLAMRNRARDAGIRVPDFIPFVNFQEIGEFLSRVPPPWVLKPRSDVSAAGIKKLEEAEQVWRAFDEFDARERLRDRPSYYLLERYVAGGVFHVDSLVEAGEVVFAAVSRYGRPPMEVMHLGGVFTSHTVEYDDDDHRQLTKLNRKLLKSLGLERGAAHAEFIKSADTGEFYFLEVAARVGGAFLAETVEAATGINLWRGWAQIELAHARGEPGVELDARREYGGIALSLARQERPDTSHYADPEIVYRVDKPHHVGLVVRSAELARVEELLGQYARRFADDFVAVAPPPERLGR